MQIIEKLFITYLIIVQALIISKSIITNNYEVLFFFCDHIALLLAITILMQKHDITKSLINIGILAQLAWTLDFSSKLIFNTYIFHVTTYIFEQPNTLQITISILIHFTTLIPAFLLTRKYKTKPKTIYYSLLYITMLYALTLLFTTPSNDINCVFNACSLSPAIANQLPQLYLPIAMILLILPTHLLQKLLSKKE